MSSKTIGMLVGAAVGVAVVCAGEVGRSYMTVPAVKPHSPCPPTPNCQCGCTATGSCTCKDCDHPKTD